MATFQHGEARPTEHSDGAVFADPDLHSHAVILNIGEKRKDDSVNPLRSNRFGALDGKAIFAWKMALGATYHLHLASELQRLGLTIIDVGKNGIFEIDGIDASLKTYLSARRNRIEEELEAAGVSSAQAPALAADIARTSRKAKRDLGGEDRFAKWQERSKRDFRRTLMPAI